MDGELERDGAFTFSGTSSSIYDYKCFFDQSSEVWLTGEELQCNEDNWDETQKKIWHFFNRPYNYGHHIGYEQRKQIKIEQVVVEAREGEVFLTKIMKYILLFALVLTFFFDASSGTSGFLIAIGAFILIAQLKEIGFKNALDEALMRRQRYQQELDHLLSQQQKILEEMIPQNRIMKVFWKRVTELESELFSSHFAGDIGKPGSSPVDFYERLNLNLGVTKRIEDDYKPKHPVILSWGLLQPSSRSFNDNRQATGINAARRDLKKKIATFRKSTDGTPLYRLFYIQFLFFREKNLNVVSLCYDLLTEKKYNVSVDTYQYNHITGTSYSQEDISYMYDQEISEDPEVRLPEELLKQVYGHQVKVISFSSTSGTSFRCVLPDSNVTAGLEDWLQYKRQSLALGDKTAEQEENNYWDILGKEVSDNEVLNKLADHSVKELWKRCDQSTGLSEHKYLKDIKEERLKQRKSRPPFAGVSQPRPV